jgi:hypothetical protein
MEEVVDRIRKKWKKDYTSNWDIDLKFGEDFEYSLANTLTLGKVEVKTERDKWKETGNIAIELMNQGTLSGLTVTKAEWWAHILSFNGNIESVILIPVDKLKRRVKQLVEDGRGKIVMGGDNNVSEIALIQIKDIHGVF